MAHERLHGSAMLHHQQTPQSRGLLRACAETEMRSSLLSKALGAAARFKVKLIA